MKPQSSLAPTVAFWGVCIIALAWLAATVAFEFHLGWPGNDVQWLKRIVGWAVECLVVRTLVLGVRRYAAAYGNCRH